MRLAAALCAAFLLPSAAFAAVLPANPATFGAALKAARTGDTIQLAPGDWSKLVVNGAVFDVSGPVTITSADPANPAILHGLTVVNSSGLVFDHVELVTYVTPGGAATDAGGYAWRLSNDHGITFKNINAHGDPTLAPPKQITGFYLNNCQGVSVVDSKFENLGTAANVLGSSGVRFLRNYFGGLNKGGVEAGGASDLLIADNHFTNFASAPNVHADAIQIFTLGTKVAASDIVITGNLIDRGDGMPAQGGIFMGDDTGGQLPLTNVVISKNLLLGLGWNSISVGWPAGALLIADNTAVSWDGEDALKPNADGTFGHTSFAAWIRLANAGGATVTMSGNTAQAYLQDHATLAAPPAGNSQVGAVSDQGAALKGAWLAAHPAYLAPAA